jgi:threonine dehydrogenase-like Zn-dependent dehydrogenase
LARQGQQVLSSIVYQHPQDFRRTIALLENGFIQPSRLISSRYAFSELPKAIAAAAGGLETKVMVEV